MSTYSNLKGRGNIFSGVPVSLPQEVMEVLLQSRSFRLERIISTGQATPAGEWYDQDSHELVVLLRGGARLCLEPDFQVITLQPGDYVHLPAHCRHRVEWTDPSQPTIWLALYYWE